MEKFPWMFPIRRNLIMLKIFGLWPPGDETYKFDFYTLYATFSITIFVICNNLTETLSFFFVHDDLQSVIQTLFVSLIHGVGILKSFFFVRNMKLLKNLMITITSDTFRVKNERQLALVNSSLRSWKLTYNVFSSTVSTAAIAFSLFPVLDKSLKDHQLPVTAWFPFNYKTSPYYELTYIYQVASIIFSGFLILNIDTLVAGLNMFIGAQCDILCDDLRHICEFDNVNQKLEDCVHHHRAILRFAQDSNIFINWIVLVQFFSSVVILAMTMFQLAIVTPFGGEFFSCLWYGNAVVVQIFMYCWFGNEVEIKSNSISYAAFESDWTSAPLKLKKNLVFIILKSQRSIKISAINLFYLTLETFMMVIRTSWSYFAVLQRVNGDD